VTSNQNLITGLDAHDIANSVIFNGDEYSMGSNGAYIPRTDPIVFLVPLPTSFLQSLPNPQSNITVPGGTGTGGGCINVDGPFGKAEAHLGPTILGAYGTTPTGLTDLFKYNPRCLKRDLNPWIMGKYNTYKNITEAVTNYTTVATFQAVLQSDSRYAFTIGNIGVHAGGHVGAGGDPMADQPSTPGDPLWFLHHAQIDRKAVGFPSH
jgi:tyrosinase